jgi:integrase
MAQKLSDRVVKTLPAPAHGNRIVYDADVTGFGCRITAAGARAFVVNYRRKVDGRERRYTIGSFPDWSVGAAREEAKRLKRAIDGGADPVGEQQAIREAPTVADLCDRFVEDLLGTDSKLRPSTSAGYRGHIRDVVKPRLGKFKVAAIGFADIQNLHRQVSKERGAYSANRLAALLAKMFSLSMRWGWRPDNPVKGIERNQEQKRERYLSNEELARLTTALAVDEDRQAADIFRLLLLTGARKTEVLGARWCDFDLTTGVWSKPSSATKQRKPHRVPLSAPARALLAGIDRADSQFTFPGRYDGHRKRVEDAWQRVCQAAGIRGVRIHDLRHSFASQLASAGIGLHTIGALLGHSQPATTHRYAHLMDDPLREATERVGAIVSGQPAAEIVPLKGGRRG